MVTPQNLNCWTIKFRNEKSTLRAMNTKLQRKDKTRGKKKRLLRSPMPNWVGRKMQRDVSCHSVRIQLQNKKWNLLIYKTATLLHCLTRTDLSLSGNTSSYGVKQISMMSYIAFVHIPRNLCVYEARAGFHPGRRERQWMRRRRVPAAVSSTCGREGHNGPYKSPR